MTPTVELFEVGGCVRDDLLGLPTKDVDFTCVVTGVETLDLAWSFLSLELENWGFKVFVENKEFLTLRARFPKGTKEFGGRNVEGLTADFVLARKDGPSSDGRRPDWVSAGTLADDLARRDFTVNAMAKASDGSLVDLFGGQRDLEARRLRAVGDVEVRFREDALRSLRAVRFMVTKGFQLDETVLRALNSDWLPPLLASVSVERRREEMHKAFRADTLATMEFLMHQVNPAFTEAVFADGLWLAPSLKGR